MTERNNGTGDNSKIAIIEKTIAIFCTLAAMLRNEHHDFSPTAEYEQQLKINTMKTLTILFLTVLSLTTLSCKKHSDSCYDEQLYQQHNNDICTQDCPGVTGFDGKTYYN